LRKAGGEQIWGEAADYVTIQYCKTIAAKTVVVGFLWGGEAKHKFGGNAPSPHGYMPAMQSRTGGVLGAVPSAAV